MKNAENRNLEDSFHIHNDGEGYPYVFRMTEDEQIEILHVAETLDECREWVRDKNMLSNQKRLLAALEGVLQIWDDLYSNQSDEAERAAWEEARAALAEAKGA